MKKKLFAIAAVVICLAITAGGTLAYYTAEQVTHNVITTGNVSAEIVEMRKVPTEDGSTRLETYPQDQPILVMPGTQHSKIVSVKNTGKGDAWVRIHLDLAITNPDNRPLDVTIRTAEDVEQALVTMDFNDADWWKDGDYYYYKQPLKAGAETAPLFTTVFFNPAMDNGYQDSLFDVTVEMQAVQAANNPVPAGGTVAAVQGWPA